ncbi:MAG: hypothetical protein K2H64_07925, partial [Desulfovibrio sp.]|nr:hypothetical protein [Desulfovibrio sp.]
MDEKTAATIASALAQKTCDAIAKDSENIEAREKEFSDLKRAVVREAAASVFGDRLSSIHNEPELLYSIAQALPGFEIESFLQSRTSFQSLAAAVVVGWIVGGLVSGFFRSFPWGEIYCARPRFFWPCGDRSISLLILAPGASFLPVWGWDCILYTSPSPR